jgi:hypothetical protein
MKDQQRTAMRDHLAKELGYRKILAKIDKPCKIWIYITGLDEQIDWIECSQWEPDESIRQAHLVLEMFDNYCIEHYWKDYEVSITKRDARQVKSGDCETISEAICVAACKATGLEV